MDTNNTCERMLSVPEVADLLGLSRSKLYLMMEAGELAFAKFGKSRRVPYQAVRSLIARHLVGEFAPSDSP
jgi:excisionase family DNA binding protein